MDTRIRKLLGVAGVCFAAGVWSPLQAQDHNHAGHDAHAGHAGMDAMPADADPHAGHHVDSTAGVRSSMVDVKLSAIPMTRQDGTRTTLDKVLDPSKPTVVAFIYTSCTTVCPLTSMVLAGAQEKLGSELAGMRIVSISIDPEYDTPQRLTEYAKKYAAREQWQHFGGTLPDSVAIQKAFNAYRGDKMNHVPLFFVHGGGKKQWLRMEGFPSADQLVKSIHAQMKG